MHDSGRNSLIVLVADWEKHPLSRSRAKSQFSRISCYCWENCLQEVPKKKGGIFFFSLDLTLLSNYTRILSKTEKMAGKHTEGILLWMNESLFEHATRVGALPLTLRKQGARTRAAVPRPWEEKRFGETCNGCSESFWKAYSWTHLESLWYRTYLQICNSLCIP